MDIQGTYHDAIMTHRTVGTVPNNSNGLWQTELGLICVRLQVPANPVNLQVDKGWIKTYYATLGDEKPLTSSDQH